MGRAIRAPGGFGLTEGLNLDLDDAGLCPDDVQIRAIGDDGIIGVHAVGQQMPGAGAFAAVFFGLPRPDRSARDFADNRRKNDVAFELDLLFLGLCRPS